MAFNSREYEWADVTLILGGVDITGIRSIKYTEKAEKEAVYAKGRFPHSIQKGNVAFEGEISVLQSEYEALVASSGGKSILGLSLDAEISYGNPPDAIITDRIIGLQFTEAGKDTKQGDKFIEIKLPFIALRLENRV
jgi:hypothetical protein